VIAFYATPKFPSSDFSYDVQIWPLSCRTVSVATTKDNSITLMQNIYSRLFLLALFYNSDRNGVSKFRPKNLYCIPKVSG